MDEIVLAERMWGEFKFYVALPDLPQVKRETLNIGTNLGVTPENIKKASALLWDRIKNIHAATNEFRADPNNMDKYHAIGEFINKPFVKAEQLIR